MSSGSSLSSYSGPSNLSKVSGGGSVRAESRERIVSIVSSGSSGNFVTISCVLLPPSLMVFFGGGADVL